MAADKTDYRGMMLVLSSPSGAGKTTLARLVLAGDPGFVMSVSVTTRPPRPGDIDGEDYFFVDDGAFDRMIEAGELLEHATVFDYRYGTPARAVSDAIGAGHDVLFDIDWQGAQQLAHTSKVDLVGIFVLPPSMEALGERLKERAQDPAEVVARRMAKATGEISHWEEYDYVVVNDDLDTCLSAIQAIIMAERLKRHRHIGLIKFVKRLIGKN